MILVTLPFYDQVDSSKVMIIDSVLLMQNLLSYMTKTEKVLIFFNYFFLSNKKTFVSCLDSANKAMKVPLIAL